MLRYVGYRLLLMIPTLIAISIITFIIIQLPPGDFLSSMMAELASQGEGLAQERIAYLRELYGLDQPLWQQYFHWIINFVQGDFGWSFEYDRPVTQVIGDKFLMTALVAFATVVVTWGIAFPIGIYSATHQYSWSDYSLTFLGFLGLAAPPFLVALVLQYYANVWFGDVGWRAHGIALHRPADERRQIPVDPRAPLDTGTDHRCVRRCGDDPPIARQPPR